MNVALATGLESIGGNRIAQPAERMATAWQVGRRPPKTRFKRAIATDPLSPQRQLRRWTEPLTPRPGNTRA